MYKLKKIVGTYNFSAQFIKIISHYENSDYKINVLRQTACLVVNPITVDFFAFLFNCTSAASDFRLYDGSDLSVDERVRVSLTYVVSLVRPTRV